jgi:dihydropteroate synthase
MVNIPFKDFSIDVTNKTIIMGILNVSPDSPVDHSVVFSNQVLERATQLKRDGATIIDIGGNSTSSKTPEITTEEELKRILPAVKELVTNEFIVSIDTWNPKVARISAEEGVHLINDVNGLQNPDMFDVVKEFDLPACIMHMRGQPKKHYDINQTYENISHEIQEWLTDRIETLVKNGIKREKIIIDPGFEFGKSMDDNLQLLDTLKAFKYFKLPLLVSASRKAFIAEAIGLGRTQKGEGLLEATLAVQTLSSYLGANILRVHDVKNANYVVKFVNKLKSIKKD